MSTVILLRTLHRQESGRWSSSSPRRIALSPTGTFPKFNVFAKQFEPLGVRVWFVYPNPGDDAKVIRAHDLEFAITANTALDTEQTLTRMAQATITPEVAVFVPQATSLHEVYRGRIDDRYLALGAERPQATHHDLEEAIRAVLANKPVPEPAGPPIGCSIVTRQP
jgi:hypothetical protein